MLGTCLSVGQRLCLRRERGDGVLLSERASNSIEVALFSSSKKEVFSEVTDVGDKDGGGKVLTGVLVPDRFGGSFESTEVRG